MTKSKNPNPPAGEGRKSRNYKAESAKSVPINPGDEIEGVFQGERTVEITDQETKKIKDVRVFQFRNSNGEPFVILGRTMLDQAFDDMYEAEHGEENVIGLNMLIRRGQNKKLSGRRSMGTYEIEVWDE